MGQAGSIEQRNAIKDVVNICSNNNKDKEHAIVVLNKFCDVFPLDVRV